MTNAMPATIFAVRVRSIPSRMISPIPGKMNNGNKMRVREDVLKLLLTVSSKCMGLMRT